MTSINDDESRFCPDCGYNLRGLSGETCPECGLNFSGMSSSPIPWEYRAELGRLKAFWRTVWLVTFRPTRLVRAVGGPVDLTAAIQFRRIVMGMVAVAVIWFYVATVGFIDENGKPSAWRFKGTETSYRVAQRISGSGLGPGWELFIAWSAGATLTPVILIGLILTLWGACRSPGLVLWTMRLDPVRRERMMVISAYACAPLTWAPICVGMWHVSRTMADSDWSRIAREGWVVFTGVTWACIGIAAITAVWAPVRVFGRGMKSGVGGILVGAVGGLPAGLVLGAVVGLGILPCVVGLVVIAIGSLR
jgi:hypothetical protein